MNIINQATLYLLSVLHDLVHNYGLAIILLTVLLRVVLWPVNSSQAKNMRKMQELQPKLKAIQEKYRDNPHKMQEALLKFYSEHKFNPMAGCLPMLIQIPIFIGLYGAISSPAFLEKAATEDFWFIDNLSHTLMTHSGKPLDHQFAVKEGDTFSPDRSFTLTYKNGTVTHWDARDAKKALVVRPHPVIIGDPITISLDFKALGLSEDHRRRIDTISTVVVNDQSRELERVTFRNQQGQFVERIPTTAGTTKLNYDVLYLLLIYAAFTLLYTKLMGPKPSTTDKNDPQAAMQQKMMQFLPIMFILMMPFFPLPAGVWLYLVATTALMFIQTSWVHWREDKAARANARPSDQIVDVKAD